MYFYIKKIKICYNDKKAGENMNLDKYSIKKILMIITFTIVLYTSLQHLDVVWNSILVVWNILFPFILGGSIAFILNIPMSFIERKLLSIKTIKNNKYFIKVVRIFSLIMSIIFIISILAIVLFIVIPELGRTFVNLGQSIEKFIPEAQAWLMSVFNDNKEVTTWINNLEVNWDTMIDSAVGFLKTGASSLLSSSMSITLSIFSGIMNFIIAIVFSCYVLLQKEKLSLQIKKILHATVKLDKVESVLKVGNLSYTTFSSFITGQCIEALILGAMFFVSMTILGFPYELLVGVLIAFTALIPIVGAFIGCFIGALLIFMQDPTQALLFIILFLVLQQIEGNFIYPYVVGNSVGLPSMWVLFSVSVGGNLMGVVGMLIFIPIMSILYVLFRQWVYRRLSKKQIKIKI